jgi:hypothetical protein
MSVESKNRVEMITASAQRKAWSKPTIVTASVRDHTEDGYTTGTDDGNGNNDFTLS